MLIIEGIPLMLMIIEMGPLIIKKTLIINKNSGEKFWSKKDNANY